MFSLVGIMLDIFVEQAEEMFDAASRYLLFPLKRAVADVLLPQLAMVPPAELCHWLILSDMYICLPLSTLSYLIDSGIEILRSQLSNEKYMEAITSLTDLIIFVYAVYLAYRA